MCTNCGDIVLCQTCGSSKDVRYTTDPFTEDVHNMEIWGHWCPDCLYESAMDI